MRTVLSHRAGRAAVIGIAAFLALGFFLPTAQAQVVDQPWPHPTPGLDGTGPVMAAALTLPAMSPWFGFLVVSALTGVVHLGARWLLHW